MADLRGRNENAAVTTREPTFSAGRESSKVVGATLTRKRPA
jgi:hypothetical protein